MVAKPGESIGIGSWGLLTGKEKLSPASPKEEILSIANTHTISVVLA